MPRGHPPPNSGNHNGTHPPVPAASSQAKPEFAIVFGVSERMHAELVEGAGGRPLVGRRIITWACGWPMQGEIVHTGSVCSPPPLLDEIAHIRGRRPTLTPYPELTLTGADPGTKKKAAVSPPATAGTGDNGRAPQPAPKYSVQIVDSFRAPSKLFGVADLNPGLSGITGR